VARELGTPALAIHPTDPSVVASSPTEASEPSRTLPTSLMLSRSGRHLAEGPFMAEHNLFIKNGYVVTVDPN
jgi:hypothetical protein